MAHESEKDAVAVALASRIWCREHLRDLNSTLLRRKAAAEEALRAAHDGVHGPAQRANPLPAAPEPLPRTAARAGISFADVLHLQGRGRQGTLDLSRTCMRNAAEECRRSIAGGAAAGGVASASVTWFVQTRRGAAPGVGLSVGSTLGTPACLASVLLLWLSVQLECGLLVCESALLKLLLLCCGWHCTLCH